MCPADDLIQPCRHNFIYPISESLPLAWIQDRLQLRGHMATVRAVPPEGLTENAGRENDGPKMMPGPGREAEC